MIAVDSLIKDRHVSVFRTMKSIIDRSELVAMIEQ